MIGQDHAQHRRPIARYPLALLGRFHDDLVTHCHQIVAPQFPACEPVDAETLAVRPCQHLIGAAIAIVPMDDFYRIVRRLEVGWVATLTDEPRESCDFTAVAVDLQ